MQHKLFDSPTGHKTLFRKLLQNNNNILATYKKPIKLSMEVMLNCCVPDFSAIKIAGDIF